jgi:hypothetical protein
MGTCSFKDFEEVCGRLGLTKYQTKKGEIWEGLDTNGNLLRAAIHKHAGGKDIPNGTFHSMIKDLGFENEKDFKDFINNKKRNR